MIDAGHLYDENYYRTGLGPVPYTRDEAQWPAVFGKISEQLIRSLQPKSVLDAGCALGFLVEAFWDRGVPAWGVDISQYAINNVRPDMRPYCRVASLAEPLDRRYELITCIEVLEHIPEPECREAVAVLAGSTDTILFSSTPDDFREKTHFNVRPTLAWLELFQEFEFGPDLLYDASFVSPHAMLLRRQPPPPRNILQLFAHVVGLRHTALHHSNQAVSLSKELSQVTTELLTARADSHESEQKLTQMSEELSIFQEGIRRLESERTSLAGQLNAITQNLDETALALKAERECGQASEEAAREADRLIESLRADLTAERAAQAELLEEKTALVARMSSEAETTEWLRCWQQQTADELQQLRESLSRFTETPGGPTAAVEASLPVNQNTAAPWERLVGPHSALEECCRRAIQDTTQQLSQLLQEQARSEGRIAELVARMGRAEQALNAQHAALTSISQSRTWRVLTRSAGLLTGFWGRPRRS